MGKAHFQMLLVSPGKAPQPIETNPDTKELYQEIIRSFAEHGYEVSFQKDKRGYDILEIQCDDADEIQDIVGEVMSGHGCVVVQRYEGGIDSFFNEPDFFGDRGGFNSEPDFGLDDPPDWELN